MTLLDITAPSTGRSSATDRVLAAATVLAPVLYLVADSMYAARGWDDADAGAVHVLGAIVYGLVLVRVASWARGGLAAATLVAGIVGACGNVAYGFNTIHVSTGAVDLVDTSGPGAIIKPLGLFCPLAFVLAGAVLVRIRRWPSAVLIGVAGLVWPVAHIANIAWLAVAVNVLLVAGFALLVRDPPAPAAA